MNSDTGVATITYVNQTIWADRNATRTFEVTISYLTNVLKESAICESVSTLLFSMSQTQIFPFRSNAAPYKVPLSIPSPLDLTNAPSLVTIWTHLFVLSVTARRPLLFTATPPYNPPPGLCWMILWNVPSFLQSLTGCLTCREHIRSVHSTKVRLYTGDMTESANMVHAHTAHVISS